MTKFISELFNILLLFFLLKEINEFLEGRETVITNLRQKVKHTEVGLKILVLDFGVLPSGETCTKSKEENLSQILLFTLRYATVCSSLANPVQIACELFFF